MTRPRYALNLTVLEHPFRFPKNREEATAKAVSVELPAGATPILGYNIDDCRKKARRFAEDVLGRIVKDLSINPDPRDPKKPLGITVLVFKAEETKGARTMKESRRKYPASGG